MQHRFSLDKSPKKFNCPVCGKRRFVRYVDNETGIYVSHLVGRCDRESNCQYHHTPKAYFEKNPAFMPNPVSYGTVYRKPENQKPLSYIPQEILQRTLGHYNQNNFVKFLHSIFNAELVNELVELYKIGTSKNRWTGATVFWQVDRNLKVRQAKVMLYNPATGKRLKEDSEPQKGMPKIYFAGKSILSKLGIESPELQQCFFGEHQLNQTASTHHKNGTVAIVESEKTAVLMTAFSRMGFAEDFIWLATGGKNGAKWSDPKVFVALKGREVILFPDLGAYDEWKSKSDGLVGCRVVVCDLFEKNAHEQDRRMGWDIADYYLEAYQKGFLKRNIKGISEDTQKNR